VKVGTTRAYREDADWRDQQWAPLDGGSAPMLSDKDDPTVLDATTVVVGNDKGTYKPPSK
jgi:hypothetical protein